MRECTKCKKSYPATTQYFYQIKRKYETVLESWCKKCRIEQSSIWQKENRELTLKRKRKHYKDNKERYLQLVSEWQTVNKEKTAKIVSDWQRNNKDKVKEYNQKRWSNKKHNIPEKEWRRCKEYFEYLCAYCGISEVKHKEIHKQQLHKEHVIHDGRNDIKNCVPSCKSCNGSKHIRTLNEWYNENNSDYTYERYLRIYQWIRYESKKTQQKRHSK